MVRGGCGPRKFVFVCLVLTMLGMIWLYASEPSGERGLWPPQRIETNGRPARLWLQGRWLVWTAFHQSVESDRHYETWTVYDIDAGMLVEPTVNLGSAVWLNGDDLYVTRPTSPTAETYSPDKNLYVLNLLSGEETLLQENLSLSALVTHRYLAWRVNTPEICNNTKSCAEASGYGCGIGIVLRDIETDEQSMWGKFVSGTSLSGMTPSLLVLSAGMTGCDCKWHCGPIQVIDLDSKEYRVVGPGSTSPGPEIYTAGLVDRTIAYVIWPEHTRVLHIEPHQPADLLLDAQNIQGVGLAGPDVLLYSLCEQGFYGKCGGLYALDMRSGVFQTLANQGDIRTAVGDGRHAAWLIENDLYLAALDLKAPDSAIVFDSPLATCPPYFLSPRPIPTLPPPRYTPTPEP